MQIIQNVVPKTFQQDLINLFMHGDVNWYYHPATNGISDQEVQSVKANSIADVHTAERPQFSHSLCIDGRICSPHYASIYPILYFLEERTGYRPSQIHRIKANLLYKDSVYPKDCYHEPHTDHYSSDPKMPKMSSFLYYINTSDGDTFFFDQTLDPAQRHTNFTVADRVTPTQGNGVLFSSNQFHASSSPVVSDRRVVLNFVMYD